MATIQINIVCCNRPTLYHGLPANLLCLVSQPTGSQLPSRNISGSLPAVHIIIHVEDTIASGVILFLFHNIVKIYWEI